MFYLQYAGYDVGSLNLPKFQRSRFSTLQNKYLDLCLSKSSEKLIFNRLARAESDRGQILPKITSLTHKNYNSLMNVFKNTFSDSTHTSTHFSCLQKILG